MSDFLQSIGSLAEELVEAENVKATAQIIMQTPTGDSLVELFVESIEKPSYTKPEWCARCWMVLTAALKRLCRCIEALRPELKNAQNARHIIERLFRSFDEIGDRIEGAPVLRGAPMAPLFQRAVTIASMTDAALLSLTENDILNGERRDLTPPWGASWEFFVSNASGGGDVNDRIKTLCRAIDVLADWCAASGRLKEIQNFVVSDESAAAEERAPEADELEQLSPEQLEALYPDVSETSVTDEVAEGEAAIADAVARAPLIGGEPDVVAAIERLVDDGMPEEPSEERPLPPPRIFHRRGRPRKNGAG